MSEQLRQYYFIVERPVGSQIWTFAAMACEQEAANSKAIAICNERKTCTRIVSAMLPKQADSGCFYALLCDNDTQFVGVEGGAA